jgi:hypothetical protein
MDISRYQVHLAGHVWLINHCRCISCSFHIGPDIFPSTCTHIKHSTYASADIRSANANICINGRHTHVTTLFGWGAFNHKSVDLKYRFAEVMRGEGTSYTKVYTDEPLEWVRFSGCQIYEWGAGGVFFKCQRHRGGSRSVMCT